MADAALITSELAANAVMHAATDYDVAVRASGPRVRIEVIDERPGVPALLPLDPAAPSGRGLHIVDRLADRWGVDLLPRGKRVWSELPARPGPGTPD